MSCYQFEPSGRSVYGLLRHIPQGIGWLAWRTVGKTAYKLMEAIGQSFEDATRALCRMATELDPRTTVEMLPEWERALSLPDSCLPEADTVEERRAWIMFRLAKRRWTTAQDWYELAELFGLQITITPGWEVQKPALYGTCYPHRYDLFPKLGRFRVYIDLIGVEWHGYAYSYPFEYGQTFPNFQIFQCILERVRPASVVILWNTYPEICGDDEFTATGLPYELPHELGAD